MLLSRRPKIDKFVRKRDSRRLVAALGYHDHVVDRQDRLYDLGTNVRRDAALALATAPDGEGVDVGAALIGALDDASGTVRAAAAASVAARGDRRALPSLAEASLTWRASRYTAARSAAIQALIVLGGPDAVEVLVETALRPEPDVAPGDVADTLTAIVDRGGEGSSHRAREAALAALVGQMGRPTAGRPDPGACSARVASMVAVGAERRACAASGDHGTGPASRYPQQRSAGGVSDGRGPARPAGGGVGTGRDR